MNKFEVVLILSPEISSQIFKNELQKFKSLISENKGKIINEEDWGLRELSYNINKFKKAFYNFFQIELTGQELDKIKKDMNQSDNLLRYIFIKVKNHSCLVKYNKE